MRLMHQVSLIALTSFLVMGCDQMASHKATKNAVAEHVADTAFDVQTANGSINVVQADGDDVRIEARIRASTLERLEATNVVAERGDKGQLVVRVDWPEGKRSWREGCSFDIQLPSAAGVSLKSSNGSLSVRGLGGKAMLRTSNGSIKVGSHQGNVDAQSSNGSLEIVDVNGTIKAKSSNGSIQVSLTDDSPGPVEARTSNGSIKLTLGSAFSGKLKLKTSNAKVKLDQLDPSVSVLSQDKKSAQLDFGGSDQQSSATTSNGSITVKSQDKAPAQEATTI